MSSYGSVLVMGAGGVAKVTGVSDVLSQPLAKLRARCAAQFIPVSCELTMLNSRSTPWLFKICLLVSLSMDSRAACSIRGRCVTFRFSAGCMVANVSSSLAVALEASEILSSSDLSSGDSFLMIDQSRLPLFGDEIVQKRIARADFGSADVLGRCLFRTRFKDSGTRQDPNRSKSNREPGSVFHRLPRTLRSVLDGAYPS